MYLRSRPARDAGPKSVQAAAQAAVDSMEAAAHAAVDGMEAAAHAAVDGVGAAAHAAAGAAHAARHAAADAAAGAAERVRSHEAQAVGPWLLRRVLRAFRRGSVTVILPSGTVIEHRCAQSGPHGVIHVHTLRTFRRVLTHGDVGFAEGYIAGEWSSPDLPTLLSMLAQNMAELDRTMDGFWPVRMWRRLRHNSNRNSKAKSRRNIAFHYDLGNDFYRLWLDESMTYSAACAFEQGQTLEAAQTAKRARITQLLALSGRETVLEIGCGWGALAIDIAREAGHVTGLTLSAEQLAFANDDIAARGLSDKIALHLRDYREEQARFDRVVSIEMLEAVGEEYWPAYFGKLRSSLAAGGRAVVQAITIREDRYESYKRSPDFIQRFIFPGGMLPTPAIMEREAATAGLAITHKECFAQGYADTLAEWRRRFLAKWAEIEPLGFGSDFKRLWEYYLAYCEAGFRTGTIDVGLYVMEPVA
jgi:cyclopropane-fatty-acyl-phospholipid synthase